MAAALIPGRSLPDIARPDPTPRTPRLPGGGASELTRDLVEAARLLGARGFVPATSGNFSVRLDERRLALTASGRDKARLTEDDLLLLDADGLPLDGAAGVAPSAEAPLHVRLYRRFPGCRAVLHVHSPAATVLSLRQAAVGARVVRLAGFEVLKALAGVTTHEHEELVPLLPNSQDMAVLGAAADRALDEHPAAHAYLIVGHGLYTWGATVAEALRHVEALEFLFDCELRLAAAPPPPADRHADPRPGGAR